MSRTRVERNISYDEEKKKYYVNLDFGRDARGHQIKKTRTFARLTDARKALRLLFGQGISGLGYVLTWPNGEPYLSNHLTETFSTFIRRNHLPKLTLHGLRHTFATLANDSDATIDNISRSLGHSMVATVSLICKHLLDTTHEQTIVAVAQSLRQGGGRKTRKQIQ